MNLKRTLIYVVIAIMTMAFTTSCSKDSDPEPEPQPVEEIDPELLGTWESKLIYEQKDLDVRLTFKADAGMQLDVKANLAEGQEPLTITASGVYKAVDGIITFKITESTDERLVGIAYQIKYEILVGQLYLQDLFLFPFDKVD